MTAGSWTASPPTCWPSKATATSNGSKAIIQDYEADKKRRLGIDADQPHRIKYKRFKRG